MGICNTVRYNDMELLEFYFSIHLYFVRHGLTPDIRRTYILDYCIVVNSQYGSNLYFHIK